jgi:hypothetical protein
MVILGGAFSAHLLRKKNRKLKTGATVKWAEYERKMKSVNAKKGWSRS